MKIVLMILVLLLPATTCALVAGYMAINRVDGWGWFLFAALVLSSVGYRSGGGSGE